MPENEELERRVLVLAPIGRDGELASRVLGEAGIASERCANVTELTRELARGAGALLVADEALAGPAIDELAAALDAQEKWSDIPLLVIAGEATTVEATRRTRECVTRLGHAVVLDRPVRLVSLVTALRSALRSRSRQYEARAMLARLEEGVEQRDRFLAMLGHELRNPLTAIVYAAKLLPDGAGKSREVIERQSRHLSRIVDELLDVARVTSGKIVLQREISDVRGVVARCVDAIRPSAQALALDVALGDAPLDADIDPVRFAQVVSNLLTNAVKYTERDGHVRVTLRRDTNDVVLSIADDGAGIEREMLPRIFDLFAQVDRTLDRARGGLGIGLTVVRALVELHGGSVRAESAGLGRGSCFEVRLPLAEAAAANEAPAAVPPAPNSARRVLIVEDDSDISETMQDLLQAVGHRVETAATGPAGVERARALEPDVVLVDVGLPGMDGYDVARALRGAFGDRVYLAALTGYGRPEDRKRAREAGFDAHLTKPVDLASVEKILRDAPRR